MKMIKWPIIHLALIVLFFHALVVIDIIKKKGKVKTFWILLSSIPIFGPIAYLSSANYNNKEASGKDIFFLILLYALLIEIVTAPLRMVSFMACSVVTFILFFIFINIVLRKYASKLKSSYILIACLLGCSTLILPIHIVDFSQTLISLPDFLFHLLGIVMGYLFYKSNRFFRVITLTFSLASCLFLYFKGYEMWVHKLNFNTFTGTVADDGKVYDLTFQTSAGDTLSLTNFKGKYLLLDCWYTYCGYCYMAMPKVQKLYDTYREDDRVSIASIHSYMKLGSLEKFYNEKKDEDYTTGSKILRERQFTFPCFAIDKENPILKEMGIKGYPTVLIFDRQSRLIFRGSIENAAKRIEQLLKESEK